MKDPATGEQLPALTPEVEKLVEDVLAAPVPSDQLDGLLQRCLVAMEPMDRLHAQAMWVHLTRGFIDDFARCKVIHRHLAVTLIEKVTGKKL